MRKPTIMVWFANSDSNKAFNVMKSNERSLCRIFVEEVLIQIIVKNLFTYAIST